MLGIIIAAGLGSRMGAFTKLHPKCLLPVAGKSLLEHTISNMRLAGCQEIVVVRGHNGRMITCSDVRFVENQDYPNNNILHSLMYARDFLEGDVLVSYSDIWVEPWIHRKLVDTKGDIVIAVDTDWQPYYSGRIDHPIPEAENVYVTADGHVEQIGKHLTAKTDLPGITVGEFLGLWRMSARGCSLFKKTFDDIDTKTQSTEPFQQALEWRRAYITDILQHMVGLGQHIDCAIIERGWAELDTFEDYKRLQGIARRQRLDTLLNWEGSWDDAK